MTVGAPPHAPAQLRSVVERGLGLTWQVTDDPYDLGLDALLGLALRDNPRRAQLVVSTVLGKHLPVAPQLARGAALLLAARLARVLGAPGPELDASALPDGVGAFAGAPLVLGFCETATALGHLVAEAFDGAYSCHTTRRPDPAVAPTAGFEEEHSHAVGHVLQLADVGVLADPHRPLVLVDDELTTGTTALNTIAALHDRWPRERYLVATLLDLRTEGVRRAFAERAARLGVQVDVVALLSGSLTLPDDVLDRAVTLRAELALVPPAAVPDGRGEIATLTAPWPHGLATGGRTGLTGSGELLAALGHTADVLQPRLSGGSVLVVGTEELMWAPLRLAGLLAGDVRFQSTTRSPVLPADRPGYAVRRAVLFPAPDEPGRLSRLHGLPDLPYDDIVVVVDTPAADALPLARALQPWAARSVQVVQL